MPVEEKLPGGRVVVGIVSLGLRDPGQPRVRDGPQRGLERLVLDATHVDDDAVAEGAAGGQRELAVGDGVAARDAAVALHGLALSHPHLTDGAASSASSVQPLLLGQLALGR